MTQEKKKILCKHPYSRKSTAVYETQKTLKIEFRRQNWRSDSTKVIESSA